MPITPTAVTLLTVPQLAEMLGKSEATIRWMIHSGSAPRSALIGGRRVFRLEGPHGVMSWLDEQFEADEKKLA